MEPNLMFEPLNRNDPKVFIKEETSSGYNVKYIAIDSEPESPRECENIGKMVCFHRRYNLGDKEHDYTKENFNTWDKLKKLICEHEDPVVILPLYLYDHSGITMRTFSFSDPFDSGQVGFIFASKEKVREVFSVVDITDEIIAEVKKTLESEVEMYDDYLKGDVYRLVKETFDKDGNQIDYNIVGGYYGLGYTKDELKNF